MSVCISVLWLQSQLLTLLTDDAARLSSAARDELPGRAKELKTEAKVYGEQIGQKIDGAVSLWKLCLPTINS